MDKTYFDVVSPKVIPGQFGVAADKSARRVQSEQVPTAEAEAVSEVEQPVDRATVTQAVEKINEFIQVVQRDLRFSVDEATGRTVITVLDAETQEIIRQIPPEEALSIVENIEQNFKNNIEEIKGMLLKTTA